METFWLDAKLMIEARDLRHAKDLLDAALQAWARESKYEGLVMYDRTGLCEEEDK